MTNNTDPDQTAYEGDDWSGFALFAYAIFSSNKPIRLIGELIV